MILSISFLLYGLRLGLLGSHGNDLGIYLAIQAQCLPTPNKREVSSPVENSCKSNTVNALVQRPTVRFRF